MSSEENSQSENCATNWNMNDARNLGVIFVIFIIFLIIIVLVFFTTMYLCISTGCILFWLIMFAITLLAVGYLTIFCTPTCGFSTGQRLSIWAVLFAIIIFILLLVFIAYGLSWLGLPITYSFYDEDCLRNAAKKIDKKMSRYF